MHVWYEVNYINMVSLLLCMSLKLCNKRYLMNGMGEKQKIGNNKQKQRR